VVGSTRPARRRLSSAATDPRDGYTGAARLGISKSEPTLRLRTRLLLVLELLIGLFPVTVSYLYHFPVAVFWTGKVIELAGEGLANAYTSGVAIAFVAGGVGLLGVWIALVSRLIGRPVSNRLVLAGVSVGILLGVSLIVFLLLAGGWWPDYFLVGAPLLVAIHQIFTLIRSNKPRIESAAI
jgi:hypothetical protein